MQAEHYRKEWHPGPQQPYYQLVREFDGKVRMTPGEECYFGKNADVRLCSWCGNTGVFGVQLLDSGVATIGASAIRAHLLLERVVTGSDFFVPSQGVLCPTCRKDNEVAARAASDKSGDANLCNMCQLFASVEDRVIFGVEFASICADCAWTIYRRFITVRDSRGLLQLFRSGDRVPAFATKFCAEMAGGKLDGETHDASCTPSEQEQEDVDELGEGLSQPIPSRLHSLSAQRT